MAKKRKRQEEKKEELEYKPPEFDRLGYVKTEVSVSKATIIAALFAIPMGFAALFVMPVGGVAGGFLTGLGGMSILWFLLPILKIDVKSFKWTQSAGVLSTHFLVFLAVWVVACNPPFNDFASPVIEDVQVSWGSGSWMNVTLSDAGEWEVIKPANVTGNMTVSAVVTDNQDLNKDNVTIQFSNNLDLMTAGLSEEQDTFTSPAYPSIVAGNYFIITAYDRNGNTPTVFEFRII